jgi:hypothetical protein
LAAKQTWRKGWLWKALEMIEAGNPPVAKGSVVPILGFPDEQRRMYSTATCPFPIRLKTTKEANLYQFWTVRFDPETSARKIVTPA